MIIEEAEDYQPEAVAAARHHLSLRQVTESDIELAGKKLAEKNEPKKLRQEKIDKLVTNVTGILQPITNPSETVDISKWIYLLCVVLALQYLWLAYGSVKHLVSFFQCLVCDFSYEELVSVLNLFFAPALIYLLLKRNRWGWILTISSAIFIIFITLFLLYEMYQYREYGPGF